VGDDRGAGDDLDFTHGGGEQVQLVGRQIGEGR
jgi:hypothetical protein